LPASCTRRRASSEGRTPPAGLPRGGASARSGGSRGLSELPAQQLCWVSVHARRACRASLQRGPASAGAAVPPAIWHGPPTLVNASAIAMLAGSSTDSRVPVSRIRFILRILACMTWLIHQLVKVDEYVVRRLGFGPRMTLPSVLGACSVVRKALALKHQASCKLKPSPGRLQILLQLADHTVTHQCARANQAKREAALLARAISYARHR
jgi:hypothetical protein